MKAVEANGSVTELRNMTAVAIRAVQKETL
jgi:hypothetical protein